MLRARHLASASLLLCLISTTLSARAPPLHKVSDKSLEIEDKINLTEQKEKLVEKQWADVVTPPASGGSSTGGGRQENGTDAGGSTTAKPSGAVSVLPFSLCTVLIGASAVVVLPHIAFPPRSGLSQ